MLLLYDNLSWLFFFGVHMRFSRRLDADEKFTPSPFFFGFSTFHVWIQLHGWFLIKWLF